MLNPKTASEMAAPGNTAIQGAWYMNERPDPYSLPPQDGYGGGVAQPNDDALEHDVVRAAEIRAGDADGGGHQRGEGDRREPDGDGDPRAVDDPAPDVAREVVGAHPELAARRLHPKAADRLVVRIERDLAGEDRHDQQRQDDYAADRAQRLAADGPQHQAHHRGPPPRPQQRLRNREGVARNLP